MDEANTHNKAHFRIACKHFTLSGNAAMQNNHMVITLDDGRTVFPDMRYEHVDGLAELLKRWAYGNYGWAASEIIITAKEGATQ